MYTQTMVLDNSIISDSLIRRLSDDIIYEVFYALAAIDHPHTTGYKSERRTTNFGRIGWIVMTHVCKRWRRIGLDMSTLWAEIVCLFPLGVETIVQRTKTTPLTLDFVDLGDPDEMWDIALKLDLFPRARTLNRIHNMHIDGPSALDWSLTLLNRHLPQLREMNVFVYNFTDPAHTQLNPLSAPELRSLSINVPLAITAPLLSSLRASGDAWNRKLLLEFLRRYPALTEIEIDSVRNDCEIWEFDFSAQSIQMVDHMDRQLGAATTVCLPHLRNLSLISVGGEAIKLLDNLELPVATKLYVFDVSERLVLASLLLRLDKFHVPQHVLTLSDASSNNSLDISFTESEPYLGCAEDIPRGIMIQYKPAAITGEIPFVLGSIPSPSLIRTLTLSHECRNCAGWQCGGLLRVDNVNWPMRSLSRFRNITTLILIGHESSYHVPSLLGTGATEEFILPALYELILTVRYTTSRTWWSKLQSALVTRCAAGRRLNRLVIRGRACHAYWPDALEERAVAYAQVTEGVIEDREIDVWLKTCEVTLVRERECVVHVVDERTVNGCDCASSVLDGNYPWEGFLDRTFV
ncbi:hypothetical protein PENSPDRAFT_750949 [Peniophora sp. CONT]|nr:hypothetical protein PENSPDRAFT_750949 [Peniophora sp. CONT]